MLANKFIVNPETTASILAANPRKDIQGIVWNNNDRSAILRQTTRMLCNLESLCLPANEKQENQPCLGLLRFHSFFARDEVANRHHQIHNGLAALTETEVLFTSRAGVDCIDFASGRTRPLLTGLSVESIRVCHDLQLLSGVIDSSRFFLYDLKQSKTLMEEALTGSICNKSIFAIEQSPKLLVATNSRDLVELDIETKKISRLIPTTSAANELDLSNDLNLIAVAMDSSEILLIDRRSATSAMQLTGHTASNFAVKFLFNYSLVTGGEDNITMFWDLRKPSKPCYSMQSQTAAVRAFEVDKERKLLYIGETAGHFSVLKLDGKPGKDVVSYFGMNAGMCLSPSGTNFYIGIAKVKPGLARFCLKHSLV